MKVLKLTLKKEWFDMFLSGKKKEEYREIKPYWIARLFGYWGKRKYTKDEVAEFHKAIKEGFYSWILQNHVLDYLRFDAVEFTNGYGKDRPKVTFQFLRSEIGIGKPNLGAPKEEVFIIKLGEEISRSNIK